MSYRELKKATYLALILFDFIGILIAFFLAFVMRSLIPGENYYLPLKPYVTLSLILGVLYLFILHDSETHKRHPFGPFPLEIWAIINSISKGTIILMAVSFLYRGFSISRLIVGFHFVMAIIIVVLFRLLWRVLVTNSSGVKKQILVLVSSPNEHISETSNGYETKSYLEVNPGDKTFFQKLASTITEKTVDCVEMYENSFTSDFILNVALMASKANIEVRIRPNLTRLMPLRFTLEESGKDLFWTQGRGLREMYPRTLKRIFDIFFGVAVFIVLLIPLLIIGIMVALSSPGGVFYRHERVGIGGKRISILKFRTMYRDADVRLKSKPELYEEFQKGFKLKNDPRITPLGNFLRKTSLDEIPQIINILFGEMSFVGPRPIVEEELLKYGIFKDLLISVPPGLTGLWQVSGRSDLTYDERVHLDLYYIENWSLKLDMSIMARTIPVILTGKGAY